METLEDEVKKSSSLPTSKPLEKEEDHHDKDAQDVEKLKLSLPKEVGFLSPNVYFYQNFWCPCIFLQNIVSFQRHFQAQNTDILITTKPKSGTTWLKAMTFAILKRDTYPVSNPNPSNPHPLLTTNPHGLIPFMEGLYSKTNPNLSMFSPPRLFSTHLPYQALAESVKSSGCRIVYLCRNPFDTVVSFLKFQKLIDEQRKKEQVSLELEEYVDYVCKGIEGFGPHWDHVLGYWKESLKNPNKVLFMKYEDIKTDEISEMKRLAQFLGAPFTLEEEERGVIEEISNLCSFQNLTKLEVNKDSGKWVLDVPNKVFFRKGEVGDWRNHLSPSMFERLDKVMQEKFYGTGLTFKDSS